MTLGLAAILLVNLGLWALWHKPQDEAHPPVAGASPGSPVHVASASARPGDAAIPGPGPAVLGAPTGEGATGVPGPATGEATRVQAPSAVRTDPPPPPPPAPPAPPPREQAPPARAPEIVLVPGQTLTEVDQYHLAIEELRFHGVDVGPILQVDSQASRCQQAGDRDREMAFRQQAVRLAAEMLIDSYSGKVRQLRGVVSARRLRILRESAGSAEELCRAGQLAEGILQYRRIVSSLESS